MKSDKNYGLPFIHKIGHPAKIALAAAMTACLLGCAAYVPAQATSPVDHPVRLIGREDAIEAAMRAAARHQELTVVGSPRTDAGQTTFMLTGVDGSVGSATLTRLQATEVVSGECAVIVTARIENDSSGVRAGRLVADFHQRWDELRRTGFAPLPRGWQ